MKRFKIFSVCFYLVLTACGIIIFNSCVTDKEDTFTGHLYVFGKIPASYSSGKGCCSDSISHITVSVYYGSGFYYNGDLAHSGSGSNNSIFDCGELWPGKYKVKLNAYYVYKVDHSSVGPCGNCNGGGYGYETKSVEVEIISNSSKTITCQ
ncbi:MAG: hypothetical protein NTZ33_11240 [Bacteroidetes bacterium]|nr:hypothetical protein [Bacteroidota bacterium]